MQPFAIVFPASQRLEQVQPVQPSAVAQSIGFSEGSSPREAVRLIEFWCVRAAAAFCNDRLRMGFGAVPLPELRAETSRGLLPRFCAMDKSRFS